MATVDHSKSKSLPKFDHRIADLREQRFTRLVVTGFAGRNKHNLILWECLCDCGNVCVATTHSLRDKNLRSRKRSCGCLGPDVTRDRSVTHGMTGTPEYHTWRSMIGRCENPNSTGYKNYGGRGITICDRWRRSFEDFYADMGPRPEGMELDRVDNDGHYEPSNCRWATIKEQANNRRQADQRVFLTHNGKTQSLDDWADELGITVGTIHHRRWKRMPIEKVLSTDLRSCRPKRKH